MIYIHNYIVYIYTQPESASSQIFLGLVCFLQFCGRFFPETARVLGESDDQARPPRIADCAVRWCFSTCNDGEATFGPPFTIVYDTQITIYI